MGAEDSVDDTRPADGADISAINNLSNYDKPQINIDPKLRRALLRVLNKLEEEDNKRSKEHNHSGAQNIVNEDDFVRYFQNHDATKEFFDEIGISKETNYQQQQEYEQHQYQQQHERDQQQTQQQDSENNREEILSFSTQDDVKDDKDYYNAPPTSPAEQEHHHHDSSLPTPITQEFQNADKYPPTIPTPNGDALYFQIPEPITLPDPTEEEHNATETLSDQKTRSVQRQATASGGNSLSDSSNDKVQFIKTDVSVKLSGFRPTPVTGAVHAEEKQTRNSTTKKVKLEKHEVEFLQAPLLTAFTVQQDELGLPRRVIPLNYQNPGPIVLPKINKEFDQQQSTRQTELDAKERLLDQQLKFLQEQQLRQQEYFKIQEFKLKQQRQLEEEKQKQILLLNQQRELENLQRSILERQRQQDLLLGKHQHVENQPQQLEVIKRQERQRLAIQQPRLPTFQQQQQLEQLQRVQPPRLPDQKTVEFQRSVDFQFRPPFPLTLPNTNFQSNFDHFQQNLNNFQSQFQPTSSSSVERNRVNRKEPSSFVGNLGVNRPVQQQVSVDSHLQNLFQQSGLTRDLRGAQEDLNIITKVLALNHHGRSQQPQFQQSSFFPLPLSHQQFQAASTRVEQIVEAPSTLITPPPAKS